MKFAYVALIGAAVAKKGRRSSLEKELTENMKAHYPASTVKGFFGILK